ncbi:glycosyl hydrolase family 28-related protein [Desulfobacca acetoxidans]
MYIESEISCIRKSSVAYLNFKSTTVNKSDEDVLTVTPTLSSAKGTDTVVDVYFTGGHSDQENYGVGQHFTLACSGATITNTGYNTTRVRLTIPAGSTTKAITMTIVNNPVLERDRVITISAAGFGASKTVTIIDDNVPAEVNIKTDYLAAGDGVTDDTAAFQSAINAIKTAGGVIYIPDGTYIIGYLKIGPHNISLVGQSKTGTILKRKANLGTVGITMDYYGYRYESAVDSKPLTFYNLTIDGNCANQGDFHGYEQEHKWTLLVFGNDNNFTYAGRLNFRMENAVIKDTITDGISIINNTIAKLYQMEFDECFRGSTSLLGGNTDVEMVNIDCSGTQERFRSAGDPLGRYTPSLSAMHMELSERGYCDGTTKTGYAQNVTLKNVNYNSGGFWITCAANSEITLNADDIYVNGCFHLQGPNSQPSTVWASQAWTFGAIIRPTTYNGRRYICIAAGTSGASEPTWNTTLDSVTTDGTVQWRCLDLNTQNVTIANSLIISYALQNYVAYLNSLGKVTFNNCQFDLAYTSEDLGDSVTPAYAFYAVLDQGSGTARNGLLTFDQGCSFTISAEDNYSQNRVALWVGGEVLDGTANAYDHEVVLTGNCEIDGADYFDYGIYCGQDGRSSVRLTLEDLIVAVLSTGYALLLSGQTGQYNDITINNLQIDSGRYLTWNYPRAGDEFVDTGSSYAETQNRITAGTNLAAITMTGNERALSGSLRPDWDYVHGLVGDIYTDDDLVEWLCTAAGWYDSQLSAEHQGVWSPDGVTVLQSDSFESWSSGSPAGWTKVTGTNNAVAQGEPDTGVKHGHYAVKVTYKDATNAFFYKNWAATNILEFFCKLYLAVPAVTSSSGESSIFIVGTSAGSRCCYILMRINAGNVEVKLTTPGGGASSWHVLGAVGDAPRAVQFYFKSDAVAGAWKLWLNEAAEGSPTEQSMFGFNSGTNQFGRSWLGKYNGDADAGNDYSIYVDCLDIREAFIS